MMKQMLLLMGFVFALGFNINAQKSEPWTAKQLMEPSELAKRIESNQTKDMLILSIGFDDVIKGSTFIGPGRDKANVEKLKQMLSKMPKDKEIVLYCGCCPFDPCPNIRPTFKAVMDMGFTNAKLLNIRKNIKTNWLDVGYPIK